MSTVIDNLERAQLRRVPAFDAGDRLRVHFQVIEGTRRRTQVFEGVVIKRQGHGARETFTVRKQSFGVGVERTFPLHSPKIERIEVASRGDVRRAKLYYLRGRVGKRARVRERRFAAPEVAVERELLHPEVPAEPPAPEEQPELEAVAVPEAAAEADTAAQDDVAAPEGRSRQAHKPTPARTRKVKRPLARLGSQTPRRRRRTPVRRPRRSPPANNLGDAVAPLAGRHSDRARGDRRHRARTCSSGAGVSGEALSHP